MKRTVIFDLDGTLVDSLPGIESSLGKALEEVMPGREMPPLKKFIGPPLPTMIGKMWPMLDSNLAGLLIVRFREIYLQSGWKQSEPFPGVEQTLAQLHDTGHLLFVLTNKPFQTARLILNKMGLLSFFRNVVSLDSCDPPFSSKQEAAYFLLQSHSLDPTQTVLMGDGLDDLASARGCGFQFVAATYGYGRVAELCENRVERFADINLHLV